MFPKSARLFAPAKLTWNLAVTGVRNDGMHLIDAEMVTLDFGDDIDVSPGDGVSYRGTWSGDGDGSDLVSRALALLGERRRVEVTKRIPAGAGLGGGSSDAAAVLRAGNFDDVAAAAELGADVAFSLVGGRARVTGIGEIVEPLPFAERVVSLLTPPIHCSTPEVYRKWDDLGGPQGAYGNDLEPAAVALVPELAAWRDRLGDLSGQRPRLAGSGSTWFVEGEFRGDGVVVARTLAAPTGAQN